VFSNKFANSLICIAVVFAIVTGLSPSTIEYIFLEQLRVKANKGDILIVLSGSGNSQNVINALNFAKKNKVKSFSILGYSGGECKKISDYSIHFKVNDMQISEDLQLITGHLCMQWLLKN